MRGQSGVVGVILAGVCLGWLGAGQVAAWDRPPAAESNIVLTVMPAAGAPVQLLIDYPLSFSSRLDLYVCTNLHAGEWEILATALSTAGSNRLSWVAAAPSVSGACFYRAGNADWDTDQDGLADARETWIYQTDPLAPDSDLDGVPDGAELRRGTDPGVGGSVVITLYVDSDAGSDSFDGLAPEVAGEHGPKHSLQSASEASYARDVIQLAGVAAFQESSLCIGTRDVSLRPLGAVVIQP